MLEKNLFFSKWIYTLNFQLPRSVHFQYILISDSYLHQNNKLKLKVQSNQTGVNFRHIVTVKTSILRVMPHNSCFLSTLPHLHTLKVLCIKTSLDGLLLFDIQRQCIQLITSRSLQNVCEQLVFSFSDTGKKGVAVFDNIIYNISSQKYIPLRTQRQSNCVMIMILSLVISITQKLLDRSQIQGNRMEK